MIAQRQRAAQIIALRKEGVLLEEEYREEIQFYMHEMEVSAYLLQINPAGVELSCSDTPCRLLSLWINNRRSSGICVLVSSISS